MGRRPMTAWPGSKAYTFLEILVALTCISVFCMVTASRYGQITQAAGVTVALQEMVQIKEAVRDHFYPDLGVIPQDPGEDGAFASGSCQSCGDDDRPWLATRYLCLRNDGEGNPEYESMRAFLAGLMTDDAAVGKLTWDRYYQRGWRGPYLEQESREQITTADGAYAFPLVTTPWADVCEALARQAEDDGDTREAQRIRRGKYYLIVVDRDADKDYALVKNTARIISFGPDGKDSGGYYTDYAAADPATPATAEDLRKLPTCDGNGQVDDDCYETGDDLVVFIFGGGATRQPQE